MAAAPLNRCNHRHDAIITWMLCHPDRRLKDAAEFFGITKEWIYRLIHTDEFQEEYKRRAREEGQAAVHSIHAMIGELAGVTIEKSLEKIAGGLASERFLGDTLKTTLAAMGYGAAAQPVSTSQTLHVHIDPQVVIDARERAARINEGSTPLKIMHSPIGEMEPAL